MDWRKAERVVSQTAAKLLASLKFFEEAQPEEIGSMEITFGHVLQGVLSGVGGTQRWNAIDGFA